MSPIDEATAILLPWSRAELGQEDEPTEVILATPANTQLREEGERLREGFEWLAHELRALNERLDDLIAQVAPDEDQS